MERFKLRCRRCRCVVVTHEEIINTHGQPVEEKSCSSSSTNSVWYISMDTDQFPWIQESVNEAAWTKGKLSCPKCHGRIGSFDFVSSSQCPCGKQTLPGVHILRDRVDQVKTISVSHVCANIGTPKFKISPVVDKPTKISENSELKTVNKQTLSDSLHMSSIFDTSVESGSLSLYNGSQSQNGPEIYANSLLQDVPLDDDLNWLGRDQTLSAVSQGRQCNATVKCQDKGDSKSNLSQKTRPRRKEELRRRRQQRKGVEVSDLELMDLQVGTNRFHLLPDEEISSDDEITEDILDEHVCPVCLDVFLHPHTCHPCGHMFCESCLRQLAQKSDNSTSFPCPMCRDLIRSCCLEQDMTSKLKILYPESYKYRLLTDRKYLSHRFPLPRSTDRCKAQTFNDRIVYAFSQRNLIHLSRLSVKGITFIAAVIFLLLVLCVSLAL